MTGGYLDGTTSIHSRGAAGVGGLIASPLLRVQGEAIEESPWEGIAMRDLDAEEMGRS